MVLFLVNVIEAIIPGLFPVWMRAEMIGIAAVIAAVILLVIREGIAERRRGAPDRRSPHGYGERQAGNLWRHYLGATPSSLYTTPARADDLSELLPPAYITTAEFDPNRDEAIDCAQRLLQADVSVELHQWPGTIHGSPAILSAEVSRRQIAELGTAPRLPSPIETVGPPGQADVNPPGERSLQKEPMLPWNSG